MNPPSCSSDRDDPDLRAFIQSLSKAERYAHIEGTLETELQFELILQSTAWVKTQDAL